MIKVENLSKDFIIHKKDPGLLGTLKSLFIHKKEVKKAVDGISFTIESGEMVGYIGANGAGKSTTIKMMTGILTPTSGTASVHGLVPYKDRQKNAKQIGVVFGQRTQLWWDLPLRETFGILKEIYQVSKEDFTSRMAYLNEVLELEEFIGQPVRTLSLGQRMRADLAASLLHNPKVLFLDEPTIGLDMVVKEKVLGAIKDINKKYGTTVILTTHDMADIEELCSRIIIIDQGKKVHDGSLNQIKDEYGFMKTLVMEIREPEKVLDLSLSSHFKLAPSDLIQTLEDTTLSLKFNSHKVKASDLLFQVMQKIPVLDMKILETSIEEIVKGIYLRSQDGRGETLNLKTYVPFGRSVIQTYLSYGINAVIFMLGGFLRVFLAYYLWMAIFDSSGAETLRGFTRMDMTLYVVLMDFIIRLTFAAEADNWVGEEVKSGAIAMNLIKPISYTGRIFAMSLGNLVYELVFVFLPMGLIFGFMGTQFLGVVLPGPLTFLGFFLSVFFGFLILFSINLSFGFLAFYLKNLWGLGNLKFGILTFLSGAFIPISFFPESFQSVLLLLPFSSIHYTPVQIFLGKLAGWDLLWALGLQAFWAGIFWIGSQMVYRGAVRHLTVQGG